MKTIIGSLRENFYDLELAKGPCERSRFSAATLRYL